MPRRPLRGLTVCIVPLGTCMPWRAAKAVDIQGVLSAALDQPQTHLLFRATPGGDPIEGSDVLGDPSFDIQSFLDTGTSAVVLSYTVWQGDQTDGYTRFNINADSYNGQLIEYDDIGIGGTTPYNVSVPYYISVAPFSSDNDVEFGGTAPAVTDYTTNLPPMRVELNTIPDDDPSEQLNIAGMPVMMGKVAVIDARPVNNLDEEHTYLYAPGTPANPSTMDTDPGIPQSQYHVKLSYASFDQFTTTSPVGAPGPLTGANPFIGPNPLRTLENNPPPDNTPPIQISFNGHTSTGSFLFDTGADVSFLSSAEAAKMHVAYAVDGQGNQLLDANGNPYLIDTDTGQELSSDFAVPVEGTGGTINAAGFNLDSLTIPTVEGEPLNYLSAPIVVLDITVQNPVTKQTLTLDGDLGMNFLVATVDPNTFDIDGGAYDWLTFDQPNGLLGLTLVGDEPIEIPTGTTVTAAADSDIGDTTLQAAFTGGTLAVTGSFSMTRPLSVSSAGGTISASPGATLTVNSPSLTWLGGPLNVTNTGTVAFGLSANNVYVVPGSTLNIAQGSNVVVSGNVDPFTDTITGTTHVGIINNGSLAINANSSVGGITGNGHLTIGDGINTNTLQLAPNTGQSTVSSLTINGSSALDLTNNHLIINYAGSSDPAATIRQYLTSGYNNGTWTGPGIDSSTAAANSASYGLGYADAADFGNPAGLASGTIEIKYTLLGDANLDGTVNGVDFGILAANFNKGVSRWDQGDFNYDGAVNGVDFGKLAANFNKGASGADATWQELLAFAASNGLMADVPEPMSAGLVLVSATGFLMRRKRIRATI